MISQRIVAWNRIKALIVKELLAVLHDKRARISLIAPPLIQLIVLAHAATLEVKNIHIAIYNQDSGSYSRELIQRIAGAPNFTQIYYPRNEADMRHLIDMETVLAAVQIQPDFSKNAAAGSASVQVILDGRKSNSSQIASSYISRIIGQFSADVSQFHGTAPTQQAVSVFRAWFNPDLEYLNYNVPCMIGVLSMILSLTITSLSVAREREMGTFDQILVSPLQPWQILLGKAVPAIVIGIAITSINLVLALILFGIPFRGSLLLLYFGMVVFVTAIIGIGLTISSITRTQQQASLGTFMFMMPTMLLCGFSTPVENIVSWLQPVSRIIPTTHFLIIVKGLFLKDMPFADVLTHVWPMALIAVGTLAIASYTFGRRLE